MSYLPSLQDPYKRIRENFENTELQQTRKKLCIFMLLEMLELKTNQHRK